MQKNNFSVLLVSTASEPFSYGLRALLSLLQNRGIDADLLFTRSTTPFDNSIKKKTSGFLKNFDKEFLSFISPYNLIGFTLYTCNLPECIQLSAIIRNAFPEKKIIFGGFHPMARPQECLTIADFLCVGEGFLSFPAFVAQEKAMLEAHAQDSANYKALPAGIWNKIEGDRPLNNGCGELCMNLDELPFPSYDPEHTFVRNYKNNIIHLSNKEYTRYLGYAYFTMFSLGCPFSCKYCGNSALKELNPSYAKVRWHSPEYIFDEIQGIRKYLNISSVVFMNDYFMLSNKKWFDKFVEEYPHRIRLPFLVSGIIPKFGAMFTDRLEKLISIGMSRGRVGIQSGSEKMLRLYGRSQDNAEVISVSEVLSRKRKERICASYDILLDGLGENGNDIIKTIKLIKKLKRPFVLNLFSLRIFPGTQLEKENPQYINHIKLNSITNYLPTLGNFIIGTMNFINYPDFFITLLEKRSAFLSMRLPGFLIRTLDIFISIKRMYSHMYCGDYVRVPSFLVKIDRIMRGKITITG